jgi:hypothetical protein
MARRDAAPMLRAGLALVLALFLVACGGGPGATVGGGGGGGGGDIGRIDACGLLTPAEIQAAVDKPVKAGVREDPSGDPAECTWEGTVASDAVAVSVSIDEFDQDLWNLEKGSAGVEAMPGIGDEAFRGFVTSSLLIIKKGNLEIDLSVISLYDDDATIKGAQDALGKLVVSRL